MSLSASDRELLKRRARALAQPLVALEQVALGAIGVRSATERYLVPVESVDAVARAHDITEVRFAPTFVLGLAEDRGELVTVVDLLRLLSGVRTAHPRFRITVRHGSARCAFAVEQLDDFAGADGRLSPPPANLPAGAREVVRGLDPDGRAWLEPSGLLRLAGVVPASGVRGSGAR